ncbi:HET-domain-containing protein, partial [Mollisia scopiformis]
ESLLCSGQTILITPNLLSALARLHDDIKTTPIWIDALCIHQESATERSAQVARMDSIYRSAQKVIIWLGPEDEN